MGTYEWYSQILKPSWAPPVWLFGPVWTVLYVGIALSFGYVFFLCIRRRLPWSFGAPFVLNLIFNLAFTPIQFGLRSIPLASADILLVLGTLIWALNAIRRRIPWVARMNIPYLMWVLFATTLQLTIAYMNY